MRICRERGVLTPFLASRRKEVIDIMELLFSQEEIWEMGLCEARRESRQEGRREGRRETTALYGELKRRLDPLGRVGELLAAISDEEKLAELVREFGLEM